MVKCKIIPFPSKMSAQEVIDDLFEHQDQYEDIAVVAFDKDGDVHFAHSNMLFLELLGMIDMFHQEVLESMHK